MKKLYCKRILPYLAVIKIPYFSFSGEAVVTNVFLIIDKDLMLIDAGFGSKNYSEMLSSAVKQLGFKLKDVSRIIYTHAHPDHMGGGVELSRELKTCQSMHHEGWETVKQYGQYVEMLKSLSKSVFSEHLALYPAEKDIYCNLMDFFWKPTLGVIKMDNGLREGNIISTGELNLEVIFTPGHSPWDISLWEEKRSILFSGDFLLKKNTTLTGGMNGFGSDLQSYESSLRKIKPYLNKAKYVFPSHGPFITSCSNLADNSLEIVKWRENRILQKLSIKKQNLMDLVTTLYPVAKADLTLVRRLGIVLTHLEKLERNSKIIRFQAADQITYGLSHK